MKSTATRKGRGAKRNEGITKSDPAPGIGAPNVIGNCPDCQRRRYSNKGFCLVCGAMVSL